jgi:hypothetical protein
MLLLLLLMGQQPSQALAVCHTRCCCQLMQGPGAQPAQPAEPQTAERLQQLATLLLPLPHLHLQLQMWAHLQHMLLLLRAEVHQPGLHSHLCHFHLLLLLLLLLRTLLQQPCLLLLLLRLLLL